MKARKQSVTKSMTEGNPYGLLIGFALPIFLGNIFQQLYNVVDLTIVSKTLGNDAMASVGTTYAVTGLIYSFINGLTGGFSIITSQHFGADNKKEMRRSIAATIVISLILTMVFTVLSVLMIRPLLQLLNTPAELIGQACDYINILLYGLLFTMLYNMLSNLLKAVGNSVMPLVFLVIASILNIGLDYLLVVVIPLGVRGASIATVLAQMISVLLCLIYIIKKCPELHIQRMDFQFDFALIQKMLTTGLSMAMMLAIVSRGSIILQMGINGLGKETIAAHTAARKIIEMAMLPFVVIGAAASTFTSQNYGAGKMDRVKEGARDSIVIAFAWCAIACAIVMPLAPQFLRLIADEPTEEILSLGCMYLRIGLPMFFPLAILLMVRNILQGIGHRVVPILASTIELFGKIIAINLLVPAFGYLGVCITEPIIWVIDGIFVLIYFLVIMRKFTSESHDQEYQK